MRRLLLTAILSLVWCVTAQAAAVIKYVDNRLTTGANDGSSAANAYRSLEYLRAGLAGNTVDQVIFVAGSGPYREVFSTRATRYKTDLSFASSDKSLNSTVTDLTTFSFTAGDIVRVKGSVYNDGQYQISTVATNKIVFIASNAVRDEADGASINVTSLNNGSNIAALDPGSNGTAARPRRWMFNGVEIDGSVTLNDANGYTWTASPAKAGEWYVRRSDGSNPSLVQVFSGTQDGEFVDDSADLGPDMGTVGSLTTASPWGWGDNDSIGYSTLYIKSTVNPGTRVIKAAQVWAGIKTTWQYHSFEDGVFSNFNRDSSDSVGGAAIWNTSGVQWWAKRNIIRWTTMNGFKSSNSSLTRADANITCFAGHRGYNLSTDSTLEVNNAFDYGSHLFALVNTPVTAAGSLTIYNSVSLFNEAGAIDKKSASGVLTEGYNVWYPRFGANGAALGYVSTANWTTTAATDFPASAATTIGSVASNIAAGALDPQLVPASTDLLSKCDPTTLRAMRLTNATAVAKNGKPIFFLRDINGKRMVLSKPDRGPWFFNTRQ